MEIIYEGILDYIDKFFGIIKKIMDNILEIVKNFGAAVETPDQGE